MERKLYGDLVIPEFKLLKGDCLETLKEIPDSSIDSVVTDPPYHLQSIVDRFGKEGASPAQHGTDGLYKRSSKGFMGKTWDGGDIAFRTEIWKECLRVLKPGGHLVAFGGTRTIHRITCSIEDSGFEIRDQLAWLYFSGFPKNRNISLDIDKMRGKAETLTGGYCYGSADKIRRPKLDNASQGAPKHIPSSEDTEKWKDFGTALKPAMEPAALARKPLEKGLTIAQNVLKWGTGAINISKSRFRYGDPCWVGPQEIGDPNRYKNTSGGSFNGSLSDDKRSFDPVVGHPLGRWPANIYQCPKPSRRETEAGLDHLPTKTGFDLNGRKPENVGHLTPSCGTGRTATDIRNTHPTVKPVTLLSWIINLITPPGGVILDPFLGSGSTAVAAITNGFDIIGCELTDEYFPIIEGRVAHALKQWHDDNRQYKLF